MHFHCMNAHCLLHHLLRRGMAGAVGGRPPGEGCCVVCALMQQVADHAVRWDQLCYLSMLRWSLAPFQNQALDCLWVTQHITPLCCLMGIALIMVFTAPRVIGAGRMSWWLTLVLLNWLRHSLGMLCECLHAPLSILHCDWLFFYKRRCKCLARTRSSRLCHQCCAMVDVGSLAWLGTVAVRRHWQDAARCSLRTLLNCHQIEALKNTNLLLLYKYCQVVSWLLVPVVFWPVTAG